MGIHLELVDFDEQFARSITTPVVVNDYNVAIPEEKEALDRLLYTHYKDTDVIDEAASCDCGDLTGVYNVGLICPVCNTPVQGTTDKPIESILWIRAPEGVPALINPQVWTILANALRTKELSFLEYLTNTNNKLDPEQIMSKETRRKVQRLLAQNLPTGYNNFINHFDEIMAFLFEANIIDSTKANKGELWQFLQQNRHKLFPKHLPIPSRVVFVVESTTTGIYIDKPITLAMDAILSITSLRASQQPLPSHVVQNRVMGAIKELANFYNTYVMKRLGGKPGLFRRHVFGSRLNFTARGVISSLSDPHDFKEIHIPWSMGVQLLKYHIINKLLKRGYGANEALEFVYSNVLRYNAEMDAILKEIIAEAPGGHLSVVLQRN